MSDKFQKGDQVEIRSGCAPMKRGTVVCRIGWITYEVLINGEMNDDGAPLKEDHRQDEMTLAR